MIRQFTIPGLIIALALSMALINTSMAVAETPLTDAQKYEVVQKKYVKYQQKFPKVMDITAEKAMAMADQQSVVFVDTRKGPERAISMLPNAVIQERLLENPGVIEGKTAVAYCTIGYRSGLFAEKMARHGIHLKNLAGGILAWVHAGGKVYDAQGESKRVHVYGKTWDYAPQGYDTVAFGLFGQISNLR